MKAEEVKTRDRWESIDGSYVIYEDDMGSFIIAEIEADGRGSWYYGMNSPHTLWFSSFNEAREYIKEEWYVDTTFKKVEGGSKTNSRNGDQTMNVKIYPREEKNIDGFTPEQLREAMTSYTMKVFNEIVAEIEEEQGVYLDLDESGDIHSIVFAAVNKAMTRGMELAQNRYILKQHYESENNVKVNEIVQYDFQIGQGISGVLLPTGQFLKCGNAQHHLMTESLPKGTEFGCIYFSSTLTGNNDGVISHSPVGFAGVTDNQLNWMDEFKAYFDNGQMSTYIKEYQRED
ncbi:hypothetical protein M5X17_31045 [Paenibacillus alvei]|uniref:hypothetical protein n=1 Tax=Paenibacillus alvei TaxID=44250 RepID=UPI00227FCD6D|nr:hypothetical protein [Paenibacillus alvei]MCY9738130.1 hypothetical protein [Paenibacillus alvei]